MGALKMTALPFGVCIWAPDFWKQRLLGPAWPAEPPAPDRLERGGGGEVLDSIYPPCGSALL